MHNRRSFGCSPVFSNISFVEGLLFFATTFIFAVESLNSAIESVVDLASPEYHDSA